MKQWEDDRMGIKMTLTNNQIDCKITRETGRKQELPRNVARKTQQQKTERKKKENRWMRHIEKNSRRHSARNYTNTEQQQKKRINIQMGL